MGADDPLIPAAASNCADRLGAAGVEGCSVVCVGAGDWIRAPDSWIGARGAGAKAGIAGIGATRIGPVGCAGSRGPVHVLIEHDYSAHAPTFKQFMDQE